MIHTTARAVAALGISRGPVIAQLLISPDGPLVAKVSARTGGGHEAELGRLAVGVDQNALAIRAVLGEPVDRRDLDPAMRAGGACVRFLLAPPGELHEIEGVDEAMSVTGVRAVHVYRDTGHVFGPLRSASDRAGAIVAAAATRGEAVAAAEQGADRIRFATAPVEAVA